jgi:urease accessory protein
MRHKSLTPSSDHSAPSVASLRVTGGVSVTFAPGKPVSRLKSLSETGGYRVKFPDAAGRAEAVLLNTGGGVAGGDALTVDVSLLPEAALTFTTQSAERIYRSIGDVARIDLRLTLGERADLTYIPQETILFQKARLKRSIAVDMAEGASLLMAETVVFGRAAMAETVTEGRFADSWRIRCGGRLIYADEVRLHGAINELLQRPAIGQGATSLGTILCIAPDAPDRIDDMRALLTNAECRAAASTWNGLLCIRTLGAPGAVRKCVAMLLAGLSRRPLPRVWC